MLLSTPEHAVREESAYTQGKGKTLGRSAPRSTLPGPLPFTRPLTPDPSHHHPCLPKGRNPGALYVVCFFSLLPWGLPGSSGGQGGGLLPRGQHQSHLTEVSVTGLAGLTIPGAEGAPTGPWPWVQGTGFSDGCDQVLVVSIAPAPPADLGLAAAGNGSPVAQVSDKTEETITPSAFTAPRGLPLRAQGAKLRSPKPAGTTRSSRPQEEEPKALNIS